MVMMIVVLLMMMMVDGDQGDDDGCDGDGDHQEQLLPIQNSPWRENFGFMILLYLQMLTPRHECALKVISYS